MWTTGNEIFSPLRSCIPQGDTFIYVDIDAIDNKVNIINNPKIMRTADAPSRATRYTKAGDVLFSMVRPYLRNIAIVPENGWIASTGFYVCSPSKLLLSQYCYYLMLSDYVVDGLNQYMKGDNSPSINNSHILSWLYPIPPLTEQQRIVKEIERWFASIDEIEQDKSDLQTIIKQAKSKILDLAIHGKLVPQNPNDEPASELLKRINPKAEITCDNGHYPQLPDGWCKCRLEDIVEYEQPQAYIVNSTDYDDRYLTPVLTAGKSFVIGYTNETEGIYQNTPCIIFDDFTTDSKLVDFPFKVKSSAMKILKVADDIEIEYVAMFMNITRLIGDTHKRYWISEYSKLCMPIPPRKEQKRIINATNAMFEKLDAIMESL
ncbi:restriction endonuclease subunit S [Bacteroides uniformis]|uniref:restriction endonuclease subunit S n=1 Tax=Bacteroides uniformis TaxID=820 RepID=UPI003218F909